MSNAFHSTHAIVVVIVIGCLLFSSFEPMVKIKNIIVCLIMAFVWSINVYVFEIVNWMVVLIESWLQLCLQYARLKVFSEAFIYFRLFKAIAVKYVGFYHNQNNLQTVELQCKQSKTIEIQCKNLWLGAPNIWNGFAVKRDGKTKSHRTHTHWSIWLRLIHFEFWILKCFSSVLLYCTNESIALNSTRMLNDLISKLLKNHISNGGMWNELIYLSACLASIQSAHLVSHF